MDVAIYDPISCPQETESHGMYLELSVYQETGNKVSYNSNLSKGSELFIILWFSWLLFCI